jgi:hypothetical protein
MPVIKERLALAIKERFAICNSVRIKTVILKQPPFSSNSMVTS